MEETFRRFLKNCQCDGLFVWADPNLLNDKKTTGHWNGENHISVFRPGISQAVGLLPSHSTDRKIDEFIASASDLDFELNTLLHEYGHWFHKHPATGPNATLYKQEEEAWEKAEEVARSFGMNDLKKFQNQKNSSLEGYRVGLGIFKNDD